MSANAHRGVVVAVRGTTPGPASGITYDLEVTIDGVSVPFNDITPSNDRWPDDYDTDAARVGSAAWAIEEGDDGVMTFIINERPAVQECPSG